jgi:hypothetical protein
VVKKTEKKGGGKLNRTQTVTLRLDPKLRYLTDLAARSQRRTTSGFIEWAIEEALSKVKLYQLTSSRSKNAVTLADVADFIWDVNETDRFLKLAISFPHLLTHHEQIVWSLIETMTPLVAMQRSYDEIESHHKLAIRHYWDELNRVADGHVGDHDKFLKKFMDEPVL